MTGRGRADCTQGAVQKRHTKQEALELHASCRKDKDVFSILKWEGVKFSSKKPKGNRICLS